MKTSIELTALDKANGLTLDQLAAFVQAAMRSGREGGRVRVTAGIKGQIKVIRLEDATESGG